MPLVMCSALPEITHRHERDRTPCHNQGGKGDGPVAQNPVTAMSALHRKILVWILLSILAASLSYAAFRGYFSAELLLGFANTFSC